jgi:hypothetical protein
MDKNEKNAYNDFYKSYPEFETDENKMSEEELEELKAEFNKPDYVHEVF